MALKGRGATVINLKEANLSSTPDYVKEAINSALQENKTRYAPSSGIQNCAGRLQTNYRIAIVFPREKRNVLVVNGGMQIWISALSIGSQPRR